MSLYDTLDAAFKESMKAKDSLRVSTLRMVRAALKNKEVELRRKLEDPEILRLLATLMRQREESVEQFRKGNRDDLADKEELELAVLASFMPKQLAREELEAEVDSIISELGVSHPKDLGKVMREAMQRLAGRADGKVVNELVREKLISRHG